MFKRVLIANRGEIACRVARTCRALGIEYVAVYTDADASSPHLDGAVAAVCIGAGPAAQSYLDGERIIVAALESGCDAIHPGYGFLSENSEFAAAVAIAGLTFVGPRPETIAVLGDKARAKALMRAAGVPVVPGGEDASDAPEVVEGMVRAVGLPALLKPSAGGGGKGMQIVTEHAGLRESVESAIRLARSSFGDGRLLVERYIEQPRHVEVQIFGDSHGQVVHLYERECSLQRRHQKVIEEAPAPGLPEATRQRLVDAAVQGARSIGYLNAGTFEFIVGNDLNFYFLEVNTRLQVEHPVTESVTGLDLVEWQFKVAAGESLPLLQEDIRCDGHAIECRIYAEDPADGFRPAPGGVDELVWPLGVRVEAGLVRGGTVPPYYDPMVAKLIAYAGTREEAIARLGDALGETTLLGLTTNIGYLRRVLADGRVRDGRIHTRYLDEHIEALIAPCDAEALVACAAVASLPMQSTLESWGVGAMHGDQDRRCLDPAAPFGRLHMWLNGRPFSAAFRSPIEAGWQIEVGGVLVNVRTTHAGRGVWRGIAEKHHCVACQRDGSWELQIDGDRFTVQPAHSRAFEATPIAGAAVAPLSGTIVVLPVRPGDRVEAGDVLAIIEAMKMEHSIFADLAGIVRAITFDVGDSVKAGELVVDVDPEAVATV